MRHTRLRFSLIAALALLAAACAGDVQPVFFSGPLLEGTSPEGGLALDGMVVNGLSKSAQYVQVTFILYGSGGEVLETVSALVASEEGPEGTLSPAEEGAFLAVSETPAEKIARIDYVIGYDDISTNPAPLR